MLYQDDNDLIVFLAGSAGCSLDSSPKKNWVEKSGGLPGYICQIARAVMRSGKSKSSAIAIAVSRTKKWAAGADGVDAKTKAKAAKAVAQWEALKAKSHSSKLVKATNSEGSEYIYLSDPSFNTDYVRQAWDKIQQDYREAHKSEYPLDRGMDSPIRYSYIVELWNDHVIVQFDDGTKCTYAHINYSVEDEEVTFHDPIPVEKAWVAVNVDDEDYSDDISEFEAALLGDALNLSAEGSKLAKIMALLASE